MITEPDRCVYCGDSFHGDKTLDHIPPDSIIPASLKNNLVTVPCCSGCQKGTSADDEWFRDMLALDKRTPASVRQELEPKMSRSWDKSLDKKISRTKRITEQLWQTQAGLVIPQLIINPDHFRLGRVVSRIIKALVYVERGYTADVKDSYTWGWSWEAFKRNSEAEFWKKRVVDTFADVGSKIVGGVLEYRVKFFEPPPEERGKLGGVWVLCFYGNMHFLGFSGSSTCDNKQGVYRNKYQRKKRE